MPADLLIATALQRRRVSSGAPAPRLRSGRHEGISELSLLPRATEAAGDASRRWKRRGDQLRHQPIEHLHETDHRSHGADDPECLLVHRRAHAQLDVFDLFADDFDLLADTFDLLLQVQLDFLDLLLQVQLDFLDFLADTFDLLLQVQLNLFDLFL
jgi:hypothetical protein